VKSKILIFITGLQIILLAEWSYSQSKNYRFDFFDNSAGLSENSIICIFQDSRGFLWIGTKDGLNRFDGYHFLVYRNSIDDTTSISNNYITDICEDKTGNLWIATYGGGLNCYMRKKNSFVRFENSKTQKKSISGNFLKSVYIDKNGFLWIGTEGFGLNIYDIENQQFEIIRRDKNNSNSLINDSVKPILQDAKGNYWVGTSRGLDKFTKDKNNFKFTHYRHVKGDSTKLVDDYIESIFEDSRGMIWIGTGRGLQRYNPTTNNFTLYRNRIEKGNLFHHNILSIIENQKHEIVFGNYFGLNFLNQKTGKIETLSHDPLNPNSLLSNWIYSVIQDRSGIYWMGGLNSGLNKLDSRKSFKTYRPNPLVNPTFRSSDTKRIFCDKKGNLWVAYNRDGFDIYDFKTQKIIYQKFPYPRVEQFMQKDENKIFVITQSNIDIYDYQTNTISNLQELTDSYIGLYLDFQKKYWVVKKNEIENITDKTKYAFPNENKETLKKIIEYKTDKILLLTTAKHFFVFDFIKKEFTPFNSVLETKIDWSKREMNTWFYESDSVLWLGTNYGLIKYDFNTKNMKVFGKSDGLSGEDIKSILKDSKNNLWIATNDGLTKLNLKTLKTTIYDIRDGLQGNNFNPNSCFKAVDGQFYFGGKTGFSSFYPDSIQDNDYLPNVVIIDFKIFNRSVSINDKNSVLSKVISETKEIVLDYHQNTISFEFVGLSFSTSEKNQYAYMLEGLEKEWNYVGTQRMANYSNLNDGFYCFKIKAANSSGVWNEVPTELKIKILPPFWKTWWAYAIYLFMFGFIFIIYRRYTIGQEKMKNALHIQELKAKQAEEVANYEHEMNVKTKELEEIKIHFYTNISHELKTPLTLINGPLEKLMKDKNIIENQRDEYYNVMHRNTGRLIRMVNQLMDFRKIQSSKLEFEPIEGDIVTFVKNICLSFKNLADERKINFIFKGDTENLITTFDPDKLDKVIFNLLSNAFKFTDKAGNIQLTINIINFEDRLKHNFLNDEKYKSGILQISVHDSGIGIEQEKLENIFTPFFQIEGVRSDVQQGTGLGLALVKELIEIQNGNIIVESKINVGTSFLLFLPAVKKQSETQIQPIELDINTINFVANKSTEKSKSELQIKSPDTKYKPKLLVVEDNTDMRKFICSEFVNDFEVTESENGALGCEMALKILPDLIISDVMMPQMSGIDLCNQLKNNINTSHIPIVLLTAKSSIESQIQGLKTGADDYIPKPFHTELLRIRIDNLLENRKKLREKYKSEILETPLHQLPSNSIDELFLRKAYVVVKKNISNVNFDASNLATKLGMSRSNLYRKFKIITDQAPNDFIISIRMKAAIYFLIKKGYSITEVSQKVGFRSQSYFSKVFLKFFTMSPTDYIKLKKK